MRTFSVSALAIAFFGAFCVCQEADAALRSEVTASSNSSSSTSTQVTSISGQTVGVSNSAVSYYFDGAGNKISTGTVDGSATARTNVGANSVGVQSGKVFVPGPAGSPTIAGSTKLTASSYWEDTVVLSDGEIVGHDPYWGNLYVAHIYGRVTFSLSSTGDHGVGALVPQLYMTMDNEGYSSHALELSPIVFEENADEGYYDWDFPFYFRPGEDLKITSLLTVEADGAFCASNCSLGFDSTHTSVVTDIAVPDGATVTSASGELVQVDGRFTYKAALGQVSPVPEPSTYMLMLTGLAPLLGLRRLRSRRRDCRPFA